MRFTLRLYSWELGTITRPVLDWLHQKSPSDREESYAGKTERYSSRNRRKINSVYRTRVNQKRLEISVKDGDDLCKEIRIENALQNEDGNEVALKEGAEVDVTVEADKKGYDAQELASGQTEAACERLQACRANLGATSDSASPRMVTKIGGCHKSLFLQASQIPMFAVTNSKTTRKSFGTASSHLPRHAS